MSGPHGVPPRGLAQEQRAENREGPGPGGLDVLELIEGPEGLQTRVLDEILGIAGLPDQPAGSPVQIGQMGQDLLLEPPNPGAGVLAVHR